MTSAAALPASKSISEQLDRLVLLGVPALAGMSEADFRALIPADTDTENAVKLSNAAGSSPVVAISPQLVSAASLAPLMTRNNKPGFVVVDITDLADFVQPKDMEIPSSPLYLINGVDRGDEFSNWTPDEALPVIASRGRTAMTVNEGISWLLQYPELLVPNHCFMTIASRKPKGKKLDSRTPALWISGGTGRDGKENKGAPKVGWCWAGNRHTWLGIASVGSRYSLGTEETAKVTALRVHTNKGWQDLATGRYDEIADEYLDNFIEQLGERSAQPNPSN